MQAAPCQGECLPSMFYASLWITNFTFLGNFPLSRCHLATFPVARQISELRKLDDANNAHVIGTTSVTNNGQSV